MPTAEPSRQSSDENIGDSVQDPYYTPVRAIVEAISKSARSASKDRPCWRCGLVKRGLKTSPGILALADQTSSTLWGGLGWGVSRQWSQAVVSPPTRTLPLVGEGKVR